MLLKALIKSCLRIIYGCTFWISFSCCRLESFVSCCCGLRGVSSISRLRFHRSRIGLRFRSCILRICWSFTWCSSCSRGPIGICCLVCWWFGSRGLSGGWKGLNFINLGRMFEWRCRFHWGSVGSRLLLRALPLLKSLRLFLPRILRFSAWNTWNWS